METVKSRIKSVWHKRLAGKIDPEILRFSSSINDDWRLIPYDLSASSAHVRMLEKQKIITRLDARKIRKGLRTIKKEYERGKFILLDELEDVHMNIEHRLKELIGSTADKLHTARSRNDLVATDLRLYTRDSVFLFLKKLIALQEAAIKSGKNHADAIMPGFTHLQQAQPISWLFYMLSYFYRFQRDFERLLDALKRVNVSPLGSCGLAGTRHDIDPDYTASLLGFDRPADNALDAVSDRDFMTEIQASLASVMLHISSFAEDMTIYASQGFKLVELDDSIATGSSIMPQKKNPDVFELLRARAAKSIGNMTALYNVLKALPSSYNRDLQEMKSIFFRAIDETSESLDVAALVIKGIKPVKNDWPDKPDFCCATEIVDYLTTKKGIGFRKAYNMVASWIRESKGDIGMLIKLSAKSSDLNIETITELLKPRYSVAGKKSKGSPGIKSTRSALHKAGQILAKNRRTWQARVSSSITAA